MTGVTEKAEHASDDSTEGTAADENSSDDSQVVMNPAGSAFDFRLIMPDIEVRMINAATLGDFEVWLYAASLSFSAAVGFLVAYIQSFQPDSGGTGSFLATGVVFVLLFIGFSLRATFLRRKLGAGIKTYKMRAVGGPTG